MKPATQLLSVHFRHIESGYAITLVGNGPLLAAKVAATNETPHRVFLDFVGVAAGSAAAITRLNNDDIERVRVAMNSRQPLVTRVVIDLARKIPYTVETVGEELRVLFTKAVNQTVENAAAIAEPVIAPPVVGTSVAPLPSTADVQSITAVAVAPPISTAVVAPKAGAACCSACSCRTGACCRAMANGPASTIA